LEHVINLTNIDIMSHITKIAVIATTSAIWEYNPSLASNRILEGSLDVIATIHTLAIKVHCCLSTWGLGSSFITDSSFWTADQEI